MSKTQSGNFQRYSETFAYKELTKQYNSLFEVGVWEIRGETPNCDFAGSHETPYLATVKGRLRDVIEAAVDLPGFWQWGSGGTITRVNIVNISSLKANSILSREKEALKGKLVREKAELQKRIDEIEIELDSN